MPEAATRSDQVEKQLAGVQRRYGELRRENADDIEQGQFVHLLVKTWVVDTDFLLKVIVDENLAPTGQRSAKRLKDIIRRNADIKNRHQKAIKDNTTLPCPIKDMMEETEFLVAIITGVPLEAPIQEDDADDDL